MINNMLSENCINLNLKGTTKSEIIDELVEILMIKKNIKKRY